MIAGPKFGGGGGGGGGGGVTDKALTMTMHAGMVILVINGNFVLKFRSQINARVTHFDHDRFLLRPWSWSEWAFCG